MSIVSGGGEYKEKVSDVSPFALARKSKTVHFWRDPLEKPSPLFFALPPKPAYLPAPLQPVNPGGQGPV